jgi:hypothetical protein
MTDLGALAWERRTNNFQEGLRQRHRPDPADFQAFYSESLGKQAGLSVAVQFFFLSAGSIRSNTIVNNFAEAEEDALSDRF